MRQLFIVISLMFGVLAAENKFDDDTFSPDRSSLPTLQEVNELPLVRNHFFVDFGYTFQRPNIGFGMKTRNHFIGTDFSFKVPITMRSQKYYKASGSILYYPSSKAEFYIGSGLSTSAYFTGFLKPNYHFWGPNFVFGQFAKVGKAVTFWQLITEAFPSETVTSDGVKKEWDLYSSFSYGFCF